MNLLTLPWLELSVLLPLAGALCVGRVRDADTSSRWCLAFTGLTLACTLLALAGHVTGVSPTGASPWDVLPRLFDRPLLEIDELSAPLLPLVALLHFLTTLATARTKMARFSFAWMLAAESVRLALFAVKGPWLLIGFLALNTLPPYFELLKRGKPTRIYVVHMALFVVLLVSGWACADTGGKALSALAAVLLLAAILIRSGTVPAHLWVADLFEHCTFGTALLFVTPIAGVYAAVRLVLPVAPDWVLQSIGVFSLVTAVYAAGMAVVQREARRFFAYLFLSHASLILVGLELHTSLSLTGALCLWFSVALSLGGLGLTLRAVEARFGRMTLDRYHGLYEHSPALAVCFLLTGLGSVGFPGTLGYVAAEVLVDGAIEANLSIGVGMALVAAINGIAIVRAYFLLFTGGRHVSTVSLGITPRERFAVLTLAALILGGGLYPQPGVVSRHKAAEAILRERTGPAETTDHPPGD
ncbi:MAG TPA: proton-conducting transporter membrane subunit [Gemmataceae bacterium]|nr:proton-conducting transporter membrane subunit [Gemmataceae bacterium]